LVTCGNEVHSVTQFLPSDDASGYTANDVIDRLMSQCPAETLQSV
jgi:hypothetical protein